jgi:hypothetical protein
MLDALNLGVLLVLRRVQRLVVGPELPFIDDVSHRVFEPVAGHAKPATRMTLTITTAPMAQAAVIVVPLLTSAS